MINLNFYKTAREAIKKNKDGITQLSAVKDITTEFIPGTITKDSNYSRFYKSGNVIMAHFIYHPTQIGGGNANFIMPDKYKPPVTLETPIAISSRGTYVGSCTIRIDNPTCKIFVNGISNGLVSPLDNDEYTVRGTVTWTIKE